MSAVLGKLDKWQKESTQVRILITGKTGTGKSAIINTFLGCKIAIEGDSLQSETKLVEEYPNKTIGDVRLRVWDSPGLQDGTENEADYLRQINEKCADVDLIIYCIRMTEARIVANGPDCCAMQKLSQPEVLGGNMWHNTIIVLTFANLVEKKAKYSESITDPTPEAIQHFFSEEFMETKKAILERLIQNVGLPQELAQSIPIVPAGYRTNPTLPDLQTEDGSRFYWLSSFWLQALAVTKLDAQPAMIKLNENRIVENEEEYTDMKKSSLVLADEAPLIFLRKGMEIGGSIKYIPLLGKVIGGAVGLAYGNMYSLSILANCGLKNKIITPTEYSTLENNAAASASSV